MPHTTAGVTINENADPSVRRDLEMALDRLVPADLPFAHLEGNSDAHAKASLMGSSVTIPVRQGGLQLGTWQGVYFAEFDGPAAPSCGAACSRPLTRAEAAAPFSGPARARGDAAAGRCSAGRRRS